jgi:hypothetical protein
MPVQRPANVFNSRGFPPPPFFSSLGLNVPALLQQFKLKRSLIRDILPKLGTSYATSVCGLKLLAYAALSYSCAKVFLIPLAHATLVA